MKLSASVDVREAAICDASLNLGMRNCRECLGRRHRETGLGSHASLWGQRVDGQRTRSRPSRNDRGETDGSQFG